MGTEHDQSPLQGQRTLAAIVFSDVVNYSGRMSRNEEHTLSLVRRDLNQMTRYCEQFEGRVLKFTGDGLLMYFSSAVQAVACALEIQKAFAARASELPREELLQHRIGIHLGDVFVSPTDVMGDGVNIAARLQSEAEPGGICLSQIVYDVVKKRLALQATYLGPRELKHIQEAVPIYQIVLAAQSKSSPLPNDLTSSSIESVTVIRQPDMVPKQPGVELPETTRATLERLLMGLIGPIATLVLRQTIEQSNNQQEMVDRLAAQVPEPQQQTFREQVLQMLSEQYAGTIEPSPTPSAPLGVPQAVDQTPLAQKNTLDPEFVQRCELELTKLIGPIARFIVQRTLSQQPGISANQFIEVLATHLPHPKAIDPFRKTLLAALS